MFCSQSIAALILCIVSIGFGTLIPSITFLMTHPTKVALIIGTCIIGYFGCSLILTCMKLYGAFITITTTSCRKCVSIGLSFLLFPKPLTWRFIFAIILVFIGIGINIYSKQKKNEEVKHNVMIEKHVEEEIVPIQKNTVQPTPSKEELGC